MSKTLGWYYNRLKHMHLEEMLAYRIPQLIQTYFLGKQQAKKKYHLLEINLNYKSPNYTLEELTKLFERHPYNPDFPVFNQLINLHQINHWRKDYWQNKISPIIYYGKIDRQNSDLHGDVKYLCEISRFEFMPFLAFHAVTCNLKHLDLLERQLSQWNEQNPYLYSIHWTSGIEVAIRSVNLIFTHLILRQFQQLSTNLDQEIRQQLTYNYQYLRNHLSLFSSANNHLMAELMGLVVISNYFEFPASDVIKWKQRFEEQIQKQVLLDGVHMERSTHYHAEVIDQLIIGTQFLKNNGQSISQGAEDRLKKMFLFTEHSISLGSKTIFGDNDEGSVILPHFDNQFCLYDSQLKSSNFLFDTNYLNNGKNDWRNYLLFGERFRAEESLKVPQSEWFDTGGFIFWYDLEHKLKFSFDVGSIGDNLLAAHGHSDIFHFNLSVEGADFLVDPGTYQYHSDEKEWRDYFKGIKAHNSISINHKNHAKNNGRMSWIDCPNVNVLDYSDNGSIASCKSQTNAFIADKVTHTREFVLNKNEKGIYIIDNLQSLAKTSKHIELYLNFHPLVKLQKERNTIIATRKNIKLILENEHFSKAKFIRGKTKPPLGWYSNSYGEKEPATVLLLELNMKEKQVITTKVKY